MFSTAGPSHGRAPAERAAFVGRVREIGAVSSLLARPDIRLVTLTGPPGIGKTRLAMQVLAVVAPSFRDGAFFVPLDTVTDPEFVPAAIAQTLDVAQPPGRAASEHLIEFLKDRQVLLILDNMEQLLPAGPGLATLLSECPEVKLLVTSRAVLRIYGEQQFRLPPLPVPSSLVSTQHLITLDDVAGYEAVALFVARAQAADPQIVFTDADAPVLAEICRQLDGLPLCIELAAARVRVLSTSSILTLLGDKLKLLADGPYDLPPRQRTLRGAISWSYDLLTAIEKQVLNRISVFAGGATLQAIEHVCLHVPDKHSPQGADPSDSALDLVSSLLDKSLLTRDNTAPEPRYTMLWTIREYAADQLRQSGESALLRLKHAMVFLELAESAEPYVTTADRKPWLEKVDAEIDNLRGALSWLVSAAGNPDLGLRLAGALHWFWYFRGYVNEGRDWLERTLEYTGTSRTGASAARVLDAAGRLALMHDDYTGAYARLTEAIRLWREVGDNRGLAYSLSNLGIAQVYRHHDASGRAMLEEAVSHFRQENDHWGLAFALDLLAEANVLLGEPITAATCYHESLAVHRARGDHWGIAAELGELARIDIRNGSYVEARAKLEEARAADHLAGDRWNIAHTLRSLGDVAFCRSEFAEAQSNYEQAAEHYRDLGDRMRMSACLRSLGHVAQHLGDAENARALYLHSMGLASELGAVPSLAWCLAALAGWTAANGDPHHAARLLGASDGLAASSNASMPPVDIIEYARTVSSVRSFLDEPRFALAHDAGSLLDLEQALAAGRIVAYMPVAPPVHSQGDIAPAPAISPAKVGQSERLSDRELEVLRLVARGLTNAEVAANLVLSPNTVRAHLYSIFSKINVSSRTAAVRFATERGLV